jgi:hypothetical protein
MPALPRGLTSPRAQAVLIGLAAAALAIGGFQTGRYTVDAAAVANKTAAIPHQPPSEVVLRKDALVERQQDQITIRDIATVPFSELYDVLKSAPREQLLAWAHDLERIPRGPRQRAAITAYYKSLIQVDHHAAIEAVLHAKNLDMRDLAIDVMLKAAPESIWGELAEMMVQLPYQGRSGAFREDVISNWSRVDPAEVSKFVETHPVTNGKDARLFSLMCYWPEIDPVAARDWLEADPSRQNEDVFRAFLSSWAVVDRAAALNYAVANALRPNFQEAIDDLAYYFVRTSPDDATRLMLLLPTEQAKSAIKNVAHMTASVILGLPRDYQRPPDEVARWMLGLPVEFWSDDIGDIAQSWLSRDAAAATAWLNGLRPDWRDAAIASFCRAAETDSAAQVVTLGATISDRSLREKALGAFVVKLGTTGVERISAINDLPITEEQKAYLEKILPEEAHGR